MAQLKGPKIVVATVFPINKKIGRLFSCEEVRQQLDHSRQNKLRSSSFAGISPNPEIALIEHIDKLCS
jgi:hypothetical protein